MISLPLVIKVIGRPLPTHRSRIVGAGDRRRRQRRHDVDDDLCAGECDDTADPPPVDTTAPTVSVTAPANGATVSGTVTLTATASDNVGVAGVQFLVDGASRLGSEDTTAPYGVSWNTTTVANGTHTLTAVARDAAGNTNTSTP